MSKRSFFAVVVVSLTLSAGAQTEAPIATNRDTATDNLLLRAEVVIDHPELLRDVVAGAAASTTAPEGDDDAPDSMPDAPPLQGDATETPGRGGYSVTFATECDRSGLGHTCESGFHIDAGAGDRVELRFSQFREHQSGPEMPTQNGWVSTNVGVKYRFYDRHGWQVAVYPSYDFDNGTRVRLNDGTLADRDGQAIYLPILISRQIDQRTTVLANIGYNANLQNPGSNSVFTSLAIGHALNDRNNVMAEVASENGGGTRRTDVRVGWVRVLLPQNHRRHFETAFFTSIGHSVGRTDDGRQHLTITMGMTVSHSRD